MTTSGAGLKQAIRAAMITALKAREKKELGVTRLIMAAIKQVEIDNRVDLDDAGVVGVLDKMVKQRRDSVKQYRDASRDDLAEIEEFEISVIGKYLPQPLTADEIRQMIRTAVEENRAESIRDMGKVMGVLKPRMRGRADLASVSQEVKDFLNNR
ncbi:MAG: GatB/YqeY domain-containing protein [Methylococcus sp.]|nr:MAG: GatB/YqeY domain-containing protein [Methylococcus sp.]